MNNQRCDCGKRENTIKMFVKIDKGKGMSCKIIKLTYCNGLASCEKWSGLGDKVDASL